MDTATLTKILLLAGTPILAILATFLFVGYQVGLHSCIAARKFILKEERDKLLVQGEKIGYEKGYEAGKSETHEKYRQTFLTFLKDQVTVMENQLPAPERDEIEYIYQ